jgi:tripartite-type tricarboxylate transporter receptor subunit TctC
MSASRWRRRRVTASIAVGALALLARGVVRAQQAWPGKLVRIIVPYTPGTGMDILARTLGPHLGSAWGQAIVVDNRPGASGNLGAAAVAKAQPDGLTLLMGVNTLIINPALYANMSYDPLKDLAPIGLCATGSFLLVASAAAKIRSVDELVKAARARPGAVSALLAGDVPLMFLPVHVAMAQVKGGRLVVLAAAGAHRSALAPDVPTLAELGYRGVEADLWYGMLAPAGTAREIILKVNADMTRALALADVRSTLAAQGMEVAPSSPEEMAALMHSDTARWAAVVKRAGIKAE